MAQARTNHIRTTRARSLDAAGLANEIKLKLAAESQPKGQDAAVDDRLTAIAITRLERLLAGVCELSAHVEGIADGLVGQEQEDGPGTNQGAQPSPAGAMHAVHYRISDLESAFDRLAAQVRRLDRV